MALMLSFFLARQNSTSLASLKLDNFWAFWLSFKVYKNCSCCTICIKTVISSTVDGYSVAANRLLIGLLIKMSFNEMWLRC